MQTQRLTMAQALIKFLDNQYILIDGEEIKFIEGILGIFGHGNVTGVGEALENINHNLRFIQGHNEQDMVHTATAFAKQCKRRRIMACTSSIGPGATNMVTGAATATTNRIPVLLLPGDIFANRQADPVLQQLEHPMDYSCSVNDCLKPVSRYWDRINRPEQLMTACIQAMRVLTDPADTGTVTLCLPQDVQAESYDYPVSFLQKRVHRVDRLTPSEESYTIAKQMIAQAKNPLIIAGGGVAYSGAEQYLSLFAAKYGIPVAVTQAGKGTMTDDHPFYVGGVGVTGTEVANKLAKQADLVIALGTRLSDFTTASKTQFQNPQVQFLSVNVNPLDSVKMDATPIRADINKVLLKLVKDRNDQIDVTSEDYRNQVEDLQSNWQIERENVLKNSKHGENSQLAVLKKLNDSIEQDAIIVAAAGSLPGDLHRFWQVHATGSYHLEYAYSCMGYEVAGGVGAKLANPEREVYVLLGDGSFLMSHAGVISSLQENIKINIILFDNQGFQCIQGLQKAHGSEGFGCDFSQKVNYQQLAESLGVASFHANDINEFSQHLEYIKTVQRTTLISIPVAKDSMSHGYDTGWYVGVADVSNNQKVVGANQAMQNFMKKARLY